MNNVKCPVCIILVFLALLLDSYVIPAKAGIQKQVRQINFLVLKLIAGFPLLRE